MQEGSAAVTASAPKVRAPKTPYRTRVWLLFIAIIVLILLVGGTVIRVGEQYTGINTPVAAVLKGQTIDMQLADTDAKRQKGLSNQEELPSGQGMLFVFEKSAKPCFWMKDMNFPVDILWFDAQKKLVYQALYALPASYPESFCSDSDARYVVELNAGEAARLKLQLGDMLDFKIL